LAQDYRDREGQGWKRGKHNDCRVSLRVPEASPEVRRPCHCIGAAACALAEKGKPCESRGRKVTGLQGNLAP
jgi:hypothetical protein